MCRVHPDTYDTISIIAAAAFVSTTRVDLLLIVSSTLVSCLSRRQQQHACMIRARPAYIIINNHDDGCGRDSSISPLEIYKFVAIRNYLAPKEQQRGGLGGRENAALNDRCPPVLFCETATAPLAALFEAAADGAQAASWTLACCSSFETAAATSAVRDKPHWHQARPCRPSGRTEPQAARRSAASSRPTCC